MRIPIARTISSGSLNLAVAAVCAFGSQAFAAQTDTVAASTAPAPELIQAPAESAATTSDSSDSASDDVEIGAPAPAAPSPASDAEKPRDLKTLKPKPGDMQPTTQAAAKFYGLNTASPRQNSTMTGPRLTSVKSNSNANARTSDFFKADRSSSASSVTVWESMHRSAARDNSMSRSISAMRTQFKVHKFNSPLEQAAKSVNGKASSSRAATSGTVATRAAGARSTNAYRNRLYVGG